MLSGVRQRTLDVNVHHAAQRVTIDQWKNKAFPIYPLKSHLQGEGTYLEGRFPTE